jgi:pilus assembly protein Flp/PilA
MAVFRPLSRDHENAISRVPNRLSGDCTKTDSFVTNPAGRRWQRCPPVPANDPGTTLVNTLASESWRSVAAAKGAPWHTGCDVDLRHRDRATERDRISHTRDGASWNAPGGSVMEFVNRLRAFVRNDEGQDLLEYALLVALIALVAVAAVAAAGGSVKQIFTSIANQLAAAA